MKQTAGACPDLETIAAYLDGRLSDRDRAAVTEHLADCEDCYAIFRESAQTHVDAGARVVSMQTWRDRVMQPRVLWSSAAALALAASLVLAVGGIMARREGDAGVRALVAAVGTDRTIEARLTGGFEYGPLRGATRGTATGDAVSPDVRIAAATLEKAAAQRPTPKNLRALGAAYLLVGQMDKGVGTLERAAQQAPKDATVLSDLAAAYLARGQNAGEPQDFERALSQADKATASNPALPEAVFNRALAFEALALQAEARREWQRYLELDSRSEWADEARRHLERLLRQSAAPDGGPITRLTANDACDDGVTPVGALVRSSPARALELFEDQVLPKWASAYLAGDASRAAKGLRCAQSIAAALVDAGDMMPRDTLDAIERTRPVRTARAELARAHASYGSARQLFEQSRFREAESEFRRVAAHLRAAGSDTWVAAGFYAENSAYYQQRFDAVGSSLPALIDFAEAHRYSTIAARLYTLKGVIEVNRSNLAASLQDYHTALAHYEELGEIESAAAVHNQIAENLQALGEPRESWLHHARALRFLPDVVSPVIRYQILWLAIQKCIRDGMPDVALHFENAFLENAAAWPSGAAIGATVSGYLQRSRVRAQIGDRDGARSDLEEARRHMAEVRDAALAKRWQMELLAAAGEISQHDSPADAVPSLTAAINGLQQSGSSLRLAHLFLMRGRAHMQEHAVAAAEADFKQGIEAFEFQHQTITEERFRISHFDEAWELFADMVRLQLEAKGRSDVALSYVERARARTLLETLTGSTRPARDTDVREARKRLPLDAAIVSFVTLPDALVAWIITNESIDVVRQPIDQHRVEAMVESLHRTIRDRKINPRGDLSALFDMLIAPMRQYATGRRTLVIVPDGALHAVPFAALFDRRTGRYLVEDYVISIAPSISVLMTGEARHPRHSQEPRVLVVGNPAINRRLYPTLPDLDGAEAEAIDVASAYPGADLLTRHNATKQAFLRLLGTTDVVHFAGHAIVNDEFPWLSRLIFAPGSGSGSDTLFAGDLAGQRFASLDLVVLAACGSAAGVGVRGEGVLSLARPFIAAGARTVVASLWDVSDRDSRTLFREFYKHVQAGETPSIALRQAQLAILTAGDSRASPINWAVFIPVTRGLATVGAN